VAVAKKKREAHLAKADEKAVANRSFR